ncbi:PEP-utilizing protein mobile subunit [Kibdelosporangium philippinense]|uniref:PEP-utilizing protein mobile subunit n=1 Tax=Kibdelosporangium philippinense TaxID=211113 RepID=A0ABS8Z918_9PSEU|nr:PEP-utilizing enzyme [Kibdelosporangium philippinense]MCE7004381.1 PEP-utilizing protein mobile subunit [Kibdelosporangium philippinense]
MADSSFPSPFDFEAPPGAEGWESMYNWYHLFGEDRRPADETKFWFQDALHHPYVMHPYDEIQCECWWQALGAMNTRIFAVPPALGLEQRILNGRLYVSPVAAAEVDIPARAEEFAERAGYYYQNWDKIYGEWKEKVLDRVNLVRSLNFQPLPDREPLETVTGHIGHSAGFRWERDFALMISTMYETYQWHFELLNIGYAAYLTFFQFCQQAFPGIGDQSVSRMVGGLHVELYRPDDELKRLAKLAEQLGVGDVIVAHDVHSVFEKLTTTEDGRKWIEDWESTRDPWFQINSDPGHPGGDHRFGTWDDHLGIPYAAVQNYVKRLRDGEIIDRPTEQVLAERDRISGEYRDLLNPDDVAAFDELLTLARKVFVYIEEHVLYIEHWMWAAFWGKSKELARSLSAMDVLADPEDLFFLRRSEVAELIFDTVAAWSTGAPGRGRAYWAPIIARRREIFAALEAWEPPPALGPPPQAVTEPLTVMLWGITTDSVAGWLEDAAEPGTLRGVAGSPGVVEGPVRVVQSAEQLSQIQEGEILVCPATSPAWAPVFSRIAATVSDVGGIMSHTAIVCREYGLPAVVGTGRAVSTLRNGQRVRVDGNTGVVTILD